MKPKIFTLILFLAFVQSSFSQGTIAYMRGGTEIRLIDPDGKNDRRLWTHPNASYDLGITDVAWRPDGKELAFSSSHASAVSIYHADIYCIKPDGTGFRKVTNAPDVGEFDKYPKGSVTVTVRNMQYSFQQSQASAGVFMIYMAGADKPQQITCPPGATRTVVFKSVADFGKKAQGIVAIWGNFRWASLGTDVEANKSVKAPDLTISGNGIELFGAFRPAWRSDGSAISYRTGVCTIGIVPANPPIGELYYAPMFEGKNPLGACSWDWGPTPALADQIIYTSNDEESNIYQIKEQGKHPGTKLTSYADIAYQLLEDIQWLPDGSGFLYSTVNLFRDASNIFYYDFKTKQTTQVTKLENEFARKFSISPDGKWIVFERSKLRDDDKNTDLWIMKLNGGGARLLAKNALSPSWSR